MRGRTPGEPWPDPAGWPAAGAGTPHSPALRHHTKQLSKSNEALTLGQSCGSTIIQVDPQSFRWIHNHSGGSTIIQLFFSLPIRIEMQTQLFKTAVWPLNFVQHYLMKILLWLTSHQHFGFTFRFILIFLFLILLKLQLRITNFHAFFLLLL